VINGGKGLKPRLSNSPSRDELNLTRGAILFQLSPVHRIYRTREGRGLEDEIFTSCGIEIGCIPGDGNSMEFPCGITRLRVDMARNDAIFEHGRTDDDKGIFEGSCPYGVWGPRLMRLKVQKLEVWQCVNHDCKADFDEEVPPFLYEENEDEKKIGRIKPNGN
jgi:hypothetical protein